MIELLTSATLYSMLGAFVVGLVLMTLTGSTTSIKRLLIGASILLGLGLIGGLWFTKGLLIFLTFQLVVFIFILYFLVIAGAVCGAGFHHLLNRKTHYRQLSEQELGDYLSLLQFCHTQELDEPRVLPLLKSGFYQGGKFRGHWYVHRSEIANAAAQQTQQPLEAFVGKSKTRESDSSSSESR